MQYRLSTLFLIFFFVAASLALGSPSLAEISSDGVLRWIIGAVWIIAVMLLAALCLNRAEYFENGIKYSFFLIFFGIVCPGLLPLYAPGGETLWLSTCVSRLQNIGSGLQEYHAVNSHFPLAYTCDKNGKPLFSWRVQASWDMNYLNNGGLSNAFNKDEPWNSPHNIKILNQVSLDEYKCYGDIYDKKDMTSYVAVIGPGTAWRADEPLKLSDLPDGGAHTVSVVEVVNSGVHWAEPRDLTVDEALEGLKTGKGLRISTAHRNCINILFADGAVRSLPSKMPISLWQKILAGEVKDVDNIEKMINPNAPDMVDVSVNAPSFMPENLKNYLGLIVWALSIVLLFRRAIKSRPKPITAEIVEQSIH
jgi:hypothetical protein